MDGDDDIDSLACIGLNVLEQEEDAPIFLPIAPVKAPLIVLPIIDTPTVVDDDEILLIEFESDKDAVLWSGDRFPKNDLCRKASQQVALAS